MWVVVLVRVVVVSVVVVVIVEVLVVVAEAYRNVMTRDMVVVKVIMWQWEYTELVRAESNDNEVRRSIVSPKYSGWIIEATHSPTNRVNGVMPERPAEPFAVAKTVAVALVVQSAPVLAERVTTEAQVRVLQARKFVASELAAADTPIWGHVVLGKLLGQITHGFPVPETALVSWKRTHSPWIRAGLIT